MRRVIGIVVAALVATLVVAGCGGDDDPTTIRAQASHDTGVVTTDDAASPRNTQGASPNSNGKNKADAALAATREARVGERRIELANEELAPIGT